MRRFLLICCLFSAEILGLFAWAIAAQEVASVEYRIKAAYLFNFAKFVEWPATAKGGPGNPISIGILGVDPFQGELDKTISGKTIDGRKLVIQRFGQNDNFLQCHILFIAESEASRLPGILEKIKGSNVLTVGDELSSLVSSGGIINFSKQARGKQETTIRFDINLEAAERAGLKISSKLLQVANVVVKGKLRTND